MLLENDDLRLSHRETVCFAPCTYISLSTNFQHICPGLSSRSQMQIAPTADAFEAEVDLAVNRFKHSKGRLR
jgi:hypothetical protein